MSKSLIPALIVWSLGMMFSGCATKYSLQVDALSTGEIGAHSGDLSYYMASANKGVREEDLFFKAVARGVEPLLSEKGYRRVEDPVSAELRIELDAYLSEPMVETRTYSEPIYVHSRGYMHSYRVPVVNKKGEVIRYHYADYWNPGYMHHGGWVKQNRQVTVFDKVLVLSARANPGEAAPGPELWTLRVSFRDRSTDYRAALPYLLMAADPYIGEQTLGEESVVILKDAPELESYKPH